MDSYLVSTNDEHFDFLIDVALIMAIFTSTSLLAIVLNIVLNANFQDCITYTYTSFTLLKRCDMFFYECKCSLVVITTLLSEHFFQSTYTTFEGNYLSFNNGILCSFGIVITISYFART